MKKFEFTGEFIVYFGKKLFRIKSLIDFGDVKRGEVGGFVEKEENLSQDGDAWVYGNARVYGSARVDDNARVCGSARVYGDAWVYGNARVCDNALVCGSAWVCVDADYACVKGFGRECRNTTFFRTKDGGVSVVCGCFHGTMQEFREKVKETHGESKMAKEYLMIADLMKMHFDNEA